MNNKLVQIIEKELVRLNLVTYVDTNVFYQIELLEDILNTYKEEVTCTGCEYEKFKELSKGLQNCKCNLCSRHIANEFIVDNYSVEELELEEIMK